MINLNRLVVLTVASSTSARAKSMTSLPTIVSTSAPLRYSSALPGSVRIACKFALCCRAAKNLAWRTAGTTSSWRYFLTSFAMLWVRSAARLVEDLLDVSRVRSGQLRLQCQRIDLRVLAAHAAQTVEFTMQQRHHRMTTSFPDAPVWLQADPARLEQVLVNLLLNAAKYTDAGGNVELLVERGEVEAVVRIRDSGIGIAPDVLPHVFDLFVQADPSSRRAESDAQRQKLFTRPRSDRA
jgi:light-regulated signal transduction histidine kinase (bacteriophytochrome)